ncbi:MAG: PIN domain-containing protein [Gemmatimonadota bacterium]
MIAYLDASVLLRMVLGQPGRLTQWRTIETGVTSSLAEVECLRTLDRLRLLEGLDDAVLAERRSALIRMFESMHVVDPTRTILNRASLPLPTTLGTLDAIHLATAMLWREETEADLVMATHDNALGLAAQAVGLAVIGV